MKQRPQCPLMVTYCIAKQKSGTNNKMPLLFLAFTFNFWKKKKTLTENRTLKLIISPNG